MKLLRKALFLVCLSLLAATAFSQTKPQKIAHCHVELVVTYMPEAKALEQELRTMEQKLMEKFNVKQAYYESKVEDYQSRKQKGMAKAEDEAAQKEIMDLQAEIKDFATESETSIAKKRQDMMAPILEKLEKALNEVADAGGYTFVINSNIGGNSVLVKAPKEDDLTLRVIKKLGITLPAEVEKAILEQK